MATPDGISNRDWNKVHTLALLLVKTSVSSNEKLEKAYRQELLLYLEKLQAEYGELPSILATRADYTTRNKLKETLYLRAYQLSEKRRDLLNQTEIAHSLAKLYIEKLRRYREGGKWLERIRAHTRKAQDKFLEQEYDRLRFAMLRLKAKNRKLTGALRISGKEKKKGVGRRRKGSGVILLRHEGKEKGRDDGSSVVRG